MTSKPHPQLSALRPHKHEAISHAIRATPKPHPQLTAQRREKLEAISHAIRAIRLSPGGWSDGQTLYKGEALDEVRKGFSNRMINLRDQIAGGGLSNAESENARGWSNTTSLMRMRARASQGKAPVPLAEAMACFLETRIADQGSKERSRLARRVLRRQFPDLYRELPVTLSMSPKEQGHFLEAAETRGMVMARDVTVGQGLVLNASKPVSLTGDGTFSTRLVVADTERAVGFSIKVELRPADVKRPRSRPQAEIVDEPAFS